MRPIRNVLVTTLASINREVDGLTRRLETARMQAAELMGNEDGIYYEREAEDEAGLVEAEAQMSNCQRRLAELQTQRAMLGDWRAQIEGSKVGSALLKSGISPATGAPPWLRAFGKVVASRKLCRVLGWVLAGIIVYATLSGIEQRPAIPGGFPDLERILAYLLTAAAFAIGYPRHRFVIFAAGFASVALLEVAQNWIPSRHGTVHDSMVKAAGLGIGILLVLLTERFKRHEGYS